MLDSYYTVNIIVRKYENFSQRRTRWKGLKLNVDLIYLHRLHSKTINFVFFLFLREIDLKVSLLFNFKIICMLVRYIKIRYAFLDGFCNFSKIDNYLFYFLDILTLISSFSISYFVIFNFNMIFFNW